MTAARILLCLHDFHRGGTERVALDLAAHWVDMGRDVTVLAADAGGGLRESVDPRVKVVLLDPPVPRSTLSRFRLGALMGMRLAALKPDVIFLPGNFHVPLATGLRAADHKPAIALKISNPPLPGGISGRLVAPVFRYFARAVDGFAAMNGGLARDVAGLVPGAHVSMLHDPVHVGAAASVARSEGCNILWVGRLEAQKDAALALRVLAAMPGAHLVLIGEGRQQADLDRAIAALGSRITRLRNVPDISPYLAAADALLITSHYEGGPAVAIEALALGTPVVSTDCSHLLREVMTIPEAGLVVESRAPEALAAALQDVCMRPRPPRAMLAALVAPFEPRRCASAYLGWFDALVAARSATMRS